MLLEFIEEFKESIYLGDPTIRSWFLVKSDYAPALMACFYLLLIKKIVPWFMVNRKSYNLKNILIVYNAAIVIYYTSILSTGMYFMFQIERERLCHNDKFLEDELADYYIAFCVWLGYLIKYVEYLDTVFFLLRKKDHLVTHLHVIHHASVPMMGWIILRSEKSGFQAVPITLNTIVHIIMYSYYCLAAFGPNARKYLWWKEYLTLLQMAQFVLMFLFSAVIWPMTGCPTLKLTKLMNTVIALLFLALFYNFYFHTYKKKKRKISDPVEEIRRIKSNDK